MTDRCNECGAKFIRYPLKDNKGKLITKNFFKMDLMSFIFVIVVLLMIVGHNLDMKKCETVIENPCGFCEDSNCCEVDWERFDQNHFEPLDLDEIDLDFGEK